MEPYYFKALFQPGTQCGLGEICVFLQRDMSALPTLRGDGKLLKCMVDERRILSLSLFLATDVNPYP
jgi:hypothetical protein